MTLGYMPPANFIKPNYLLIVSELIILCQEENIKMTEIKPILNS